MNTQDVVIFALYNFIKYIILFYSVLYNANSINYNKLIFNA